MEEEDAYKVELAAPVLMLSELERPNMVLAARRPALRNTEFATAVVSLLLDVCGDIRGCLGRIGRGYSRLLRLGQIQYAILPIVTMERRGSGGANEVRKNNCGDE